MLRFILVLLLALVVSAHAQQSPPAPEVQALGERLQREINAAITCEAGVIALRRELEAVKAELASLKETKPDAKQ